MTSSGTGATTKAQVLANLQTISALSTAGDLTVTGNDGGPFTVVFGGTLAGANQPQIGSSTTASTTTATTINGNSTPPVTVTGNQGGPFTLTFGGSLAGIDAAQVTSSSTAQATTATTTTGSAPSAANVQINLGTIPALLGNITVTGGTDLHGYLFGYVQ